MSKEVHIYKHNESNKKNCLMILPRPIFPLISGYSNKNFNLIPNLASEYNLHLVTLSTNDYTKDEKQYYESYITSWTGYIISKQFSWIQSALYLLKREPIQAGYFYRKRIKKDIMKLSENADVIIGCLIRTVPYLQSISPNKIRVFDMVDSIGTNYYNSIEKTSNFFWKSLYRIESKRLIKKEQNSVKTFNITFFVNKQEEICYQPYGTTVWLPHGVKSELFHYDKINPEFKNSIVFIGKMDYQPNIEAVKWYIRNVHNQLKYKNKLIVVGACPTKELFELSSKYENIEITGYCDDPYIYLKSCLAIIAPMQTGGGIQNKVLEGMAIGNINIVSSLAAASIIGANDKEHFFVATTSKDYISLINELMINKTKYTYIAQNAQSFVKQTFTWDSYNKAYINEINKLISLETNHI